MPRTAILLVLSFAGLAFAGCVDLPQTEGSHFSDLPPRVSGDGTMSAEERVSESVELCRSGGSGFCAVRKVDVTGAINGLEFLETTMETFNGDVSLLASAEGTWSMAVVMKARGSSPEDAKAAVDGIGFEWAHERGGAHFLDVKAWYDGKDNQHQRSATVEVRLPASLLLRAVLDTINGDAEATGVRADGISISSVNGDVVFDGQASQVVLDTVNGDAQASVRTSGSGRISLDSVNGDITLKVAEDAERGYDLQGRTTNGEVEIGLRDGEVGPCPQGSEYYTPPCNQRSFKTTSFDGRSIRTQVVLDTTNGEIVANPL